MRRGIAGVTGARIVAAAFPRTRVRPLTTEPRPAVLAGLLVGRTIAAVLRRGKRVVLELAAANPHDDTRWLAIEPRMTGLMLLVDPPTEEHVRLVLSLDGPSRSDGVSRSDGPQRLLFWDRRGLGTIRLHDRAGLDAACGPRKLGPDGLDVTGAEMTARLGRSRRAVKPALLDQRAVAGIGNIYAAEILFRVGIDPRSACRRLSRDAWERIAAATRSVLAEAVHCEGSSIGDETYRTADNRVGQFQHRHRVYGREGEPCAACGTPVIRIVQAQRATFFCGECQRRPGARGRSPGSRRGPLLNE